MTQRQLVVDIHLVPADLVDPDHRPLGFQIVELLPEPGSLRVDRQRGDLGQLRRQAAQDVRVARRKLDLFGDRRRFVMARIVQHG